MWTNAEVKYKRKLQRGVEEEQQEEKNLPANQEVVDWSSMPLFNANTPPEHFPKISVHKSSSVMTNIMSYKETLACIAWAEYAFCIDNFVKIDQSSQNVNLYDFMRIPDCLV